MANSGSLGKMTIKMEVLVVVVVVVQNVYCSTIHHVT